MLALAPAGAIHWARLLFSRVKQTMAKLLAAQPDGAWRATPAGAAVHDRYLALGRAAMNYERDAFAAWAAGADAAAMACLKQPVLAKGPATGRVGVNFRPELRTLMLEARYLDRHRLEIPPVALQARLSGALLPQRRWCACWPCSACSECANSNRPCALRRWRYKRMSTAAGSRRWRVCLRSTTL